MIVDDAEDTVEMLRRLLESEGYNILTATNGEDALKLLRSKEETPDLIILDMFMPLMSGREVCKRIRDDASLKDIKIVFFTVAAFSELGKQMLKDFNVLDYITKPFDVDDFLKRIRKALDR